MGNTIRVGDIPAQLTAEKIRGEDNIRLIKHDKIDVQLVEGTLEVRNVPDCWVATICKEISEKIGRTLNWEDPEIVSFDGILRGGDYVSIDSSDGGRWSGTVSVIHEETVFISAIDPGTPGAKVPLWAVVRGEKKWEVYITDPVSKEGKDMNVIDENKYPPEKLVKIGDPINVQMAKGGGGTAKISNIRNGIVEIKFNIPFPDVKVPSSGIKRLEDNPGIKWVVTIKDFSTRDADGVNIIVEEEPKA